MSSAEMARSIENRSSERQLPSRASDPSEGSDDLPRGPTDDFRWDWVGEVVRARLLERVHMRVLRART